MLLVSEIYAAIMGESRFSGWPCALVRLAGCHRRCRYCDTAHAYDGGEPMTVAEVLARVEELGHNILLLTGGEPLLQTEAIELMEAALASERRVVLETGGTRATEVPLAAVPPGVCRVVDIKTPGSGIAAAEVDWDSLRLLTPDDEIKLVLTDERDYVWARRLVTEGLRVDGHDRVLPAGVPICFSPAWGLLPMRDLAAWILRDRLAVRFQIQLHKVVWPERDRGV